MLSISFSYVKQKQQEAKEASERLLEVEKEQKDKENELEKLIADFELNKQRTEEGRNLAELSQSRAEAAKEASSPDGQGTVQPSTVPKNFLPLHNGTLNSHKGDKEQPLQKALPVKLKGVDLPTFSGKDKTDYESWKAAFMSLVDRLDILVGEKILRLLNSLKGKALTLVKDLGSTSKSCRHGEIPRRTRKSDDSTARQWTRQGVARTKLEPCSQGKTFGRGCSIVQLLAY